MSVMNLTPPKVHKVPDRILTQRMEALERANVIRTLRAQLKRDLKAGHKNVYDLLIDPPKYIHSMRIVDLLLATPKRGSVKVNIILKQVRMSPSKTILGMSQRQRIEVLSLLRR